MASKVMKYRCRVNILDFHSNSDGKYKYILFYQDDLTKFVVLRPLKTQDIDEIANVLLDIFLLIGAPCVLQSDNGTYFCKKVIQKLESKWPELRMLYGKPKKTDVERVQNEYQDIQEQLTKWMVERQGSDWTDGLRIVQFMINRTFSAELGKCPYEAVFSCCPRVGLCTYLPHSAVDEVIAGLSTYLSGRIVDDSMIEENLEKIFSSMETNDTKVMERNFFAPKLDSSLGNCSKDCYAICKQCKCVLNTSGTNKVSPRNLNSLLCSSCLISSIPVITLEENSDTETVECIQPNSVDNSESNGLNTNPCEVENEKMDVSGVDANEDNHLVLLSNVCSDMETSQSTITTVTTNVTSITTTAETGTVATSTSSFENTITNIKVEREEPESAAAATTVAAAATTVAAAATTVAAVATTVAAAAGSATVLNLRGLAGNMNMSDDDCIIIEESLIEKEDLSHHVPCLQPEEESTANHIQIVEFFHLNTNTDYEGTLDMSDTNIPFLQNNEQEIEPRTLRLRNPRNESQVMETVRNKDVGYSCKKCKGHFVTSGELKTHACTVLPVQCCTCLKRFEDKKSLRRHSIVTHHNGPSYRCEICGELFILKHFLKRHVDRHFWLPCIFCSKKLPPQDMAGHIQHRHCQRRYMFCTMCNRRFYSLKLRILHSMKHVNEGILECGFCSETFTTKECLSVHIQVHIKEMYPCMLCSQNFQSYPNLTEHVKQVHPYGVSDSNILTNTVAKTMHMSASRIVECSNTNTHI